MAADLEERDRLGELYRGWYVPISRLLAGPGRGAWSDDCPQVYVARHGDVDLDDAFCPEGGGVSTLVTLTPPWDTLVQRMPARGATDAWTPAEYRRASAAYDLQEKVLNGLASHVVAPADGQDPHTVAHQVLGRRNYGTVTVIDDDPDTLVAFQVGNSYGPLVGYTLRVTADGGDPHPPLTRALYGAALDAWHLWWHEETGQPPTMGIRSVDQLAVPWPAVLEIDDPHAERPYRIRLTDITPTRLGAAQ